MFNVAEDKMKSKKLLEKSAEEHNLTHLLKVGGWGEDGQSSRGGGGGGGRIGKKGRFQFQRTPDKPKTRKELRKEARKNKKAMKHTYILSKFGRTPETDKDKAGGKKKRKRNRKRNRPNQKPLLTTATTEEGGDDGPSTRKEAPTVTPGTYVKVKKPKAPEEETVSQRDEDDKELVQLKKEMEETRKRRLLEENAEEDKFISRMEKRLKLNKKAKIPASFKTDGLDCKFLQFIIKFQFLPT